MTNLKKFLIAGAALALVAVASVAPLTGTSSTPTASAASSDYFLKLDGIDGEIAIESFSWGVSSPRDAASGQSTGRRQYQPIIIRKRIDKSTPLLFKLANDPKARTGHVTVIRRTDGKDDYKVTFLDNVLFSFLQAGDVNGDGYEDISFSFKDVQLQ